MQAKIPDYADGAQKDERANSISVTEIGSVPEDWEIVRLRDIAEKLKAGGTPRTNVPEYWNGSIPFVKIEDITATEKYLEKTKTTITETGLRNSNAWLVPKNSILLSMYATIGELAINRTPLATNQAILAIIPKNCADVEFLFYCLKYHGKRLYSFIVQTTQKNVNKGITENLRIPLPPISEQQRIAKVLSTIQRAIEQQDRIIETTQVFKKSLMQKLFTEGIKHTEFKETEIRQIPVEWEVVELRQVAEIKTSTISPYTLKYSSKELSEDDSVKILYLKVADLNSPLNTFYVTDAKEQFRVKKETASRLNVVPPFSTVFPKRGGAIGTNKKRITRLHCMLDPNLIAVVPSRKIDPVFLYQWFQTFDLVTIADRTTIPQLNKKDVEPIKIPLPAILEQQGIAHVLCLVDDKIEIEEKKKTTLRRLFGTMLHKLMTGDIRLKEVEV